MGKVCGQDIIGEAGGDWIMKLLELIGFLGVLALSSLWSGYVLTIIWKWFMVPAFGLPALSIPMAIGLIVTAHCIQKPPEPTTRETEPLAILKDGLSRLFLYPLISLLVGWVVHHWV